MKTIVLLILCVNAVLAAEPQKLGRRLLIVYTLPHSHIKRLLHLDSEELRRGHVERQSNCIVTLAGDKALAKCGGASWEAKINPDKPSTVIRRWSKK